MPSLKEILQDPNYVNANEATKQVIFDKFASQDENYTLANSATKDAIRSKFGINIPTLALPSQEPATSITPQAPMPSVMAPNAPIPQTFEGVASENPDTGIADTIKDYLVKPVTEAFGGNYDEEAKHPYVTSTATGLINSKNAYHDYMITDLTQLLEAKKEQYGPNFENAPKSELKTIQQTQKDIQSHLNDKAQNIADIQATQEKYSVKVPTLSKKLDDLEATKEYQNSNAFGKFQLLGKEIAKNPSDIPEYVSHVGLESLPTSLPMMIGATVASIVGGPSGAMMAGGGISAFTEFGSEYVQLRQEGKSNEEATAQAATKSGVIGYFDALSFGSAGKTLEKIMENVGKGIWQTTKSTAKEVGKETGKQAAFGAAGEGVGSIVSGQPVQPRSVLEEAIGEVSGAPLEAVSTYRGNIKEAKQAQAIQDLKDKVAGMTGEQPEPKPPVPPEATTPPTETPQPNVVTPEALIAHATSRLKELNDKATSTPSQAMTPQEVSEHKFLMEYIDNPDKLAEGYGVTIGKPQVTGSQNTQAALDELEGKQMPISPSYQPPVETKPAEPEVPPTPEKPPVEETPPVETKPEEKPPVEETPPQTQGAIVKDSNGTEHPLPTIADAEKNGAEYSPINRDKPMYVKTDLEGVFDMIYKLFKENSNPYVYGTTTKVTSNKNATLPKTSNKNQVSVTFRPDTLSGRQLNDNEFMSYDTANKAIESFTIYNPASRLKVTSSNARIGVGYLDKFFNRGLNTDGSITYTLKRVKSQEEKQADNERLSKEYLEHINRSRGKLTYKYTRKSRPGLNEMQQVLDKHKTLGSAFKEVLDRLEKAIADNQYEVSESLTTPSGTVEKYSGTDPFLKGMYKNQAEMYIDIIKHLMKIEPVIKAHLFMDPYIVGGKYNSTLGFYRRTENILALFANADLSTLVHEGIHAATHHYITMHPNDAKVQKLNQLLQASRKNDKKIRGKWKNYGNTNLDEFIAESFSDVDFIKHLKAIDPVFDKSEATSIFDNIKTIVSNMMKAMGINTSKDRSVFDEVMDLSSDLFTGKTLEGYRYDAGHPLDTDTGSQKQIKSESFKKWFGDSKVVNQDGSPKVMYHGTTKSFDSFKSKYDLENETKGAGIYFTSDSDIANKYTKNNRGTMKDANIMPVYLKMENPYVYPTNIWQQISAYLSDKISEKQYKENVSRIQEELGYTAASRDAIDLIPRFKKSQSYDYKDLTPGMVKALKNEGYDGIVSPRGDMHIVFDPNQVKSAIGNKGTFSLESDVITENQRPITEEEAQQEEGTRQVFNYRGEPIDIRKWEIPEQGPIATKLSKWFQEFADEHVILTKVSNAIKALGRTISDMSDMEKKQELKNSKISDQLLRFANEEVNPILKEMIAKGVSMDEIKQYLHARHAEAYNNRMNDINHKVDAEGNIIPYGLKDRASGMSTEDANNYLNSLTPEREQILRDIADKWYAIRDKTQQILVDSGQETQDTIDLWQEIYPDYVPLNREQEQQAVPAGMRTGQGVDTRGNFSKRAMGSEKAIINPIDALLYQRERAVARAENNEVGKSVYRLALENPNPDFWMAINPDAIHSREKLIEELRDMGYEDAEGIADNIMAEPKERYMRKVRESDFVIDPNTGLPIPNSKEVVDQRISRNARFGDNVLTLKINGRERYVFFNQKDPNAVTMVRTLKNLDAQTLNAFLRVNRFFNHYFGQLYTVLNPVFGVVNGIRDYPFGMANLSTTPIRGKQVQVTKKIFPAMMGIMSVLRKERAGDGTANARWQQIYKEATQAGFQTSNRYGILNTGEDQSYIEQTLAKFKDNNSKKAFRYIIGLTYDFASTIENAVRLAAYQQMREEGYSPQESASVAKNLTINFDKKGSRTAALRSLYLFFNASIRGTVRLAETLKGPAGKQIIAGGMLLGIMQALMMAAAGYKDDDPPEYIKEHNLIIPTGDGKYKTIPMPYGLNILPNTGRIITEYAVDVNKNGFKKAKAGKKAMDLTNSFFSTFSPFGNQGISMNALIPSAIEPIAAVAPGGTNKNSFGQTISKQDSYTRPTPGYMRTKESGSSVGKGLARWINLIGGTDASKGLWSPTGDDIDFLANSYFGPVLGSINKTAKYIHAQQTGEEVPAYQVPVLGRFQGETDTKPVITSRFYTNLNAMYEHELALKNLKGDAEATRKYIQDHPDARAYKRAEHVESQINDINARKKKFEIRGAPQETLQRLDNQKIIIMNRFNDQLDKIRSQ
jgi:hypothetical protein